MIQKGIIQQLDPNNNTAIVRIPMYETSQNERAMFNCIMSTIPGLINGYQVDDVVFVDFENNDLDYPIIVGKLYTGVQNEQNGQSSLNLANLECSGTANFSESFTVGEVTYKDLLSMKKYIQLQEDN